MPPPAAPRGNLAKPSCMEQLSKAYVRAIAATAGCTTTVFEPDFDAVDITIKQSCPSHMYFTSPSLDIQLKATHQESLLHGTYISHTLDRRTYDILRNPKSMYPHILVVFYMEREFDDWLDHDEARLEVRRCAYWVSLRGADPLSDEQASKTVRVPRDNRFDVAGLLRILQAVGNGEQL